MVLGLMNFMSKWYEQWCFDAKIWAGINTKIKYRFIKDNEDEDLYDFLNLSVFDSIKNQKVRGN